MEILKIDHIGTRVNDVKKAIRFYEKLNFKSIRNDNNEKVYVVKHPSGLEINFLNNITDNANKENVLMDIPTKHAGYTHFALRVKSVTNTIAFLNKNKITITEGPVTFGDGKTSVFIRDPDRNVIEFTEVSLINDL